MDELLQDLLIIAGLGKTLQIVCFCKIFLRYTDSKTIICIVNINTIEHWISEFDKWLHREEVETNQTSIKIHVLNDVIKTFTARLKVITEWSETCGVLLLGYELFRRIIVQKVPNKSKQREEDQRMLNTIQDALLKSNLVVCDEGHRIKNMLVFSQSLITLDLMETFSKTSTNNIKWIKGWNYFGKFSFRVLFTFQFSNFNIYIGIDGSCSRR